MTRSQLKLYLFRWYGLFLSLVVFRTLRVAISLPIIYTQRQKQSRTLQFYELVLSLVRESSKF